MPQINPLAQAKAEWVRSEYMSVYHGATGDELGRAVLLPSGKWVASLGATGYIGEYAHREGAERAVEQAIARKEQADAR